MLAERAVLQSEGFLMEAPVTALHAGSSSSSAVVHHPHHSHHDHHHHASIAAHSTSPIGFLTHDVEEEPPLHAHTTSVNRSYSDLHQGRFLCYAFGLCALRTALQHPMNLALARKQTCAAANKLSTWGVLTRIYTREGQWRGLAQGIGALSLGCALSEVIYLCIFEWGREQVPVESAVTRDVVSGYAADVACRTVHIPLSIIAFRQMTAPPTRRLNAWGTLRHMYAERGLRTVFAGFGTTLVVGCQWTAMWWALYGQTKAALYGGAGPHLQQLAAADSAPASRRGASWRLPSWVVSPEDNVLINGVASVTTSAATAVLFNPYLVVRTNLQVTRGATLWSVTQQLYRTRGLRGFYSGLLLSVNACVVDGAMASTSYEYAKLWADRTRDA